MADIAAADVTYTEQAGTAKAGTADPRREGIFSVAFGNGTLTYPTGGVPLDKAKLGCPSQLDELIILDSGNANGFVYKWDAANNKIRIYQGDNDNAADAALIELVGATATPAAATLKVKAKGW